MDKIKLLRQNVDNIPQPEYQTLLNLAHCLERLGDPKERDAIARHARDLAIICARRNAKRTSDRRTDNQRRTLVGARVRREEARRYQQAAKATGRTLYRFVCDALAAEAQRVGTSSSGMALSQPKPQEVEWTPLPDTISCIGLRSSSPPGQPGHTTLPWPPGPGQGGAPGSGLR